MLLLFFSKNLDHASDLFENNGKMRSWEDLRAKLGLDYNKKIIRDKLFLASLALGKKRFQSVVTIFSDLIINEHHLIKKHQIYCLEKLSSRERYNMQHAT